MTGGLLRCLACLAAASALVVHPGPVRQRQRLVRPRITALGDVVAAAAIATAAIDHKPAQLPTWTISKTEIREGIYGSYELTVPDTPSDTVDDARAARSTFKTKAETKKNRNKYVGLFAVLLVGSFIIPMLQYFWYVRDTPESPFGPKNAPPPPPPPPKKKGPFGLF